MRQLIRRIHPAALCAGGLAGCAGLESGEEFDWREHPHHISVLFAGAFEQDESAPSVGLDYEYRVSEFLGLGGVAERAFGDIDATTLLAVADLHLTRQFIIQTGPGVEFLEGEAEAAYRMGVLYEFEGRGYTISPQLHYDWVSGEDSVVAGIAVGYGF